MTKAVKDTKTTPKKKVRMRLSPAWVRTRKTNGAAVAEARTIELRPADSKVRAPAPPAIAADISAVLQVQMIPLDRILADPTQPRKEFEPAKMAELVDSIKKLGVELPIRLRPMSRWRQIVSLVARQWVKRERGVEGCGLDVGHFWGAGIKISAGELISSPITDRLLDEARIERAAGPRNGFVPTTGALQPLEGDKTLPGEPEWLEIVYGERRWRGSQEAGCKLIPARVSELTDIDAAELQAIENLDRADLKPLEEAAQYRKLLDTPGYDMPRLVHATGKARNTIYGKLKLLDLPKDVRDSVAKDECPESTAELIGRLEPELQAKAAKAILHPDKWALRDGEKVLSHRAAKDAIAKIQKEDEKSKRWIAARDEAQRKNITPLSDEEARKEQTYDGEPGYDSKYVSPKKPCWDDAEGRTWGKLLGKQLGELRQYLGRDFEGNGHVWILRADAAAKVAALGIKLKPRSGFGSGGDAAQKQREAAERKRRKLQVEKENAGLAEITAAVERLGVARLSADFWRELASTIATDCWSDTTRRISARRGCGIKGRANETLAKQAQEADAGRAVALLTEVLTVGLRGGSYGGDGLLKKIARMRAVLGLAKVAEGESADARNAAEEEPEPAEVAA
jgi:ParB/RepB/Spo0J family partition protein